jgi:hypothetical protein
MKKATYRRHTIELSSEQLPSGGWVAKATVLVVTGKVNKIIPIFGRRRASFDTKRQADAYALELAKLWVDEKIRGGNGRG